MRRAQYSGTVALYARSAREDEDAHLDAEDQLEAMRAFAEQNNMEPVARFVDKYGSREEFDWMLAQATSDNPPFRLVLERV